MIVISRKKAELISELLAEIIEGATKSNDFEVFDSIVVKTFDVAGELGRKTLEATYEKWQRITALDKEKEARDE